MRSSNAQRTLNYIQKAQNERRSLVVKLENLQNTVKLLENELDKAKYKLQQQSEKIIALEGQVRSSAGELLKYFQPALYQ